jgi:hypothetical protein
VKVLAPAALRRRVLKKSNCSGRRVNAYLTDLFTTDDTDVTDTET